MTQVVANKYFLNSSDVFLTLSNTFGTVHENRFSKENIGITKESTIKIGKKGGI